MISTITIIFANTLFNFQQLNLHSRREVILKLNMRVTNFLLEGIPTQRTEGVGRRNGSAPPTMRKDVELPFLL